MKQILIAIFLIFCIAGNCFAGQITYADKVKSDGVLPVNDNEKVSYSDMNSIKTEVNDNDERITELENHDHDGTYEPVVTEGSLPNSVVVSDDIKNYEVSAEDLNNTQNWSGKTITLPNTVYDFTPSSDDTWQGNEASVTAGESITQWNIIYIKYDTDGPRAFNYNADSTDSDNDTYRPRGVALQTKTAGNSLSIGIGDGVARNDGWTFSDASDEGKPVFAGETDGAITLTRPSGSGDHIVHLGNLIDEDEIEFNFGAFADVVVP